MQIYVLKKAQFGPSLRKLNNTKNIKMSVKTKWAINPANSKISFKVMHLMISNVKGLFKKFEANIETNENDFTTTKIALWIDLASLETGDKKRDEHLKSAEFFDVSKHKKITFVSDSFVKTGKEGCYNLWGYLTMKGITNRIKLDVKSIEPTNHIYSDDKAGFAVNAKLSRNDWGLNWNMASANGSIMGSDEVFISCEIELLKMHEQEQITKQSALVNM
jgi:polyisoprenoid-binding protein YceI